LSELSLLSGGFAARRSEFFLEIHPAIKLF